MILKLDLDSSSDLRAFTRRLPWVARRLRLNPQHYSITRSASGRGWHVVLTCRPSLGYDGAAVAALQVILGSDWRREVFFLRRIAVAGSAPRFWRDRSNILYTQKGRL